MTKQRIAVLGAGPMGLAVAYQLIKEGYLPVIFEADDRVGGMTASFDFNGLMIERYYHFHCISDSAFLSMLNELGIDNQMCWRETRMGYYYQGSVQAWGNPMALLRFPDLSLLSKFRYGLHAFFVTKRNNWKKLDRLEATRWIKRWVGEEAYSILWQKLFDYKFYDYSASLSAAWIWSRIRRIGRSRYSLFREKLGYLQGGSATLLQAMTDYIEFYGGKIHLNTPVSRVVIENASLKGILCLDTLHSFNQVISTIPLPYLPNILPDLPKPLLNAYQSIRNIAVVCVILQLAKRLTENFWLNVNDSEMDIPGLVEYSNLRSLDRHIIYAPFYMPYEHAKFQDSNERFIKKIKCYLMKINPTLMPEDFIAVQVSRYRYAQPICFPRHLAGLPPVDLPIKGLWAADTSYYYPEDRGISESIEFGRNLVRKILI